MSRVDYESWCRALSAWARSGPRNVVLFESIGSTNEAAGKLLARADRPRSGSWWIAFEQRSGRGRFDRSWASPRGAGVYASYLFEAPAGLVPALPQLVGVALCEALARFGADCRLKWPNDLLLEGSKLGGILLQARGSGERVGAVAGFGVNHSQGVDELPRADATSLRLAGVDTPPLAELASLLAEGVEREVEGLLRSPETAQRQLSGRYASWSAHRPGDRLTVSLGDGVCRGRFAGFSPSGELRLVDASGERRLSAGEVES